MPKVILVAGGTAGHINAALSVAEVFDNDHEIQFVSGQRYLDLQLFKDKKTIHISSQPLRTKNPFKLLSSLLKNLISFLRLYFFFLLDRPIAVIGAGGYVCGPTLLAAKLQFIPVFIIEQNAVMGLTNRLLSKVANLIFLNFKKTKGVNESPKVKIVGNPIRKSIQYQKALYIDSVGLLVFGGSLGATQINEVVFRLLSKNYSFPLKIFHQVGKGNLKSVEVGKGIEYKQVEYIDNMQEAYSKCNIVLSRAGASTISELRAVKRPSIIIPFPFATDNHQHFNAVNLKEEGLFPVEILDFNLSQDELVEEVYQRLLNLRKRLPFIPENNKEPESAALKVKHEVLTYVRS